MGLIAGDLELDDILTGLAQERPVFHSEADFQHSLAARFARMRPTWRVRLEVPVRSGGRSSYVDVVVTDPDSSSTAIELKYFTGRLEVDVAGEAFMLREHAASDLARLNFVRDIARLEASSSPSQNGIAVMLTNVASLWRPPTAAATTTRDRAYRIHEGVTMQGALAWGDGDFPANDLELAGRYEMNWRDYSHFDSPAADFRFLAVEVAPTSVP
ncbi:hypothetical protein AB1207_06690 [Kineococcus endophyticus]|uniref:Uncharacterized protein n=1 Tax=Kineococcus endophyticus TaxID=1181883 RepID=A0ABV3P4V6_9ACTN